MGALVADVLFDCNAQVVASSYAVHSNDAFRYIFAVPPAKHADDLSYSFYSNGDNPSDTVVVNMSVASVLQQIITSLAISGIPKSAPHQNCSELVSEYILCQNKKSLTLSRFSTNHR